MKPNFLFALLLMLILSLSLVQPIQAQQELTWVRTGGPLGGLGYDVRMRPDNPELMYVSDAWAGVHLSTDGGQTWFPSNEGITTRTGESGDAIPVFSLTIDPNNYDIIWVGTQFQRGIFKSTDGGKTWKKMDSGVTERDGITFRGLTVEPGNSEVVYAAAEISSWADGRPQRQGREFDMTEGVVYQTKDGGKSWKAVWRGKNMARYVWIDPRDVNVIYIGTGLFDREAANSDPQSRLPGGEGVVKSTDGGKTWQTVNTGLNNLYVGTLYMHPQNPDILLAGTGNNQYYENCGIYLTNDGGGNWKQVLSGDIINSVEFSDADPNMAYAGSSESIYRSEDGGQTWEKISGGPEVNGWGSPGVRAGFPIDFQVDPRDPKRIFANEYGGGNFLSTDGGETWEVASTGYTGAQVRAIAVDPQYPGRVYAAARSGLFVSQDGGATWQGLNHAPARSMEWNAVGLNPQTPAQVIAANNWNGAILTSADAGQTWENTPTFIQDKRMGWRVIAFAPSNPEIVYAGSAGYYSAGIFDLEQPGQGVYVSTDGGATWEAVNGELLQEAHVTDLEVSQADAALVFAATHRNGIVRTNDGGKTWESVNQGLPNRPALSLALNPADNQILLAGFSRAGLYRSQDGGTTWKVATKGLPPEASVTSIVFDPANPQVVFAADSQSGVYHSENGGESWKVINNGLRTHAVNALAISADGMHLYAATEGEGVFRLDLSGQPPAAAPAPEIPTMVETGPKVDGSMQDWDGRVALANDPLGDGEADFIDLTNGYAYVTDEALYFLIEIPDAGKPFVHFDIHFQVDEKLIQISWAPQFQTGSLGDITNGYQEIGEAIHSKFALGQALEGRVDFRDLGAPGQVSLRRVNVMVGECCMPPAWRPADTWETSKTTPSDAESLQKPTAEPTSPPAVESQPTTAPTQTPGGGPCPAGLAPLALIGMVFLKRRRE